MAPSEPEERCAALICDHLNKSVGDAWRVRNWLDDQHNSEASPDVLLTNGADDIAVEITRLTDGYDFHTYEQTTQSLYRRLAPERTRSFSLVGPGIFKGPLQSSLVSQLRSEIARASAELSVGDSTVLRTRRATTLRFLGAGDPSFLTCFHAQDNDLRPASTGISGAFQLEDEHYPDHRFVTDDGRRAFCRVLREASDEARRDNHAEVEWYEEWDLHRHGDLPDGEGGVLMTWGTAAFLEGAAIQSVDIAIEHARRKFSKRKWAKRTALALHAGERQWEVPLVLVEAAVDRLGSADVQPLDSVFLVSSQGVRRFDFAGRA